MTDNEKILSMLEALTNKVDKIEQGQDAMQTEQQRANKRLNKIEENQYEMQEDIEFTRGLTAKIEGELSQQTMILREGYFDNEKLAKNYEPRIEKLEETVENLSIDVNYLKSVG